MKFSWQNELLILLWWLIIAMLDVQSQVVLEITPRGNVIYKIPGPLDCENWCIFVALNNQSTQEVVVERIQFTTFRLTEQRASISRNMSLSVKPGTSAKLQRSPEFFWDCRDANVDKMKIDVFHSLGKSSCEIPLVRYEQKIKVRFPLHGVWKVGSAHEFGISHRRWDNRSHFGWDFIKCDADGKTYSGDYRLPQSHYAFGQSVFAPTGCVVLETYDGESDHAVGIIFPKANSVFLDLGDGVICCMSHLRCGSILVQKGQRLNAGQMIAEVGNSGQSDLPHLHIHFQLREKNVPDPLKPGIPLPFSLSDYFTISPHGTWIYMKEGHSQKGDFIADMIETEKGIYQIPLILPASLESQRKELEETLLSAQMIIRDFAKRHGWEELTKQSFADRAEIYDKKEMFDRRLLELAGVPLDTRLPKEYSAALEKRVLIAVSPQLYAQNYPDGIEKKSFEKLLAHEIAHRLHIRILNGNEEAMGPIWFFEGFAIYAAGQFEKSSPELNRDEIWEIVKSPNRGSYKKYATVFRHFLKKATLQELVKHAGKKDFLNWLEKIDMGKSKVTFWDTQLGQMITIEGTARNARMGAMLETGHGTLWMDNMEEWPGNANGKLVVVKGVLIKRHDLPVFVFTKEMKSGKEPIPSGMPVEEGTDLHEAARRYLLQNVKWEIK